MKKTICLITNWFPTKDNPYQGLFFKEQALAVSDAFDFIVLRCVEHKRPKIGKRAEVKKLNREENITEYAVDIYLPLFSVINDHAYDLKANHRARKKGIGTGCYISPGIQRIVRSSLIRAYHGHVKTPFDIVYCVDGQREAFYCKCLADAYKKPYIVGEHAPVPWPGTLIADVNKEAIESADLFLAISEDKKRQFMLQNIKLPKTVYLGNLVNEEKLHLTKKAKNDIKTLIIVAAHSYYKNYDMFIETMNRLTEITVYDFKVMIVGYAANKGYSQNIGEFEEKIKKSKFIEHAVFLPEVPHEEIGEVLNRADAFVMTSIQEGQPVSAMEAACCGLPVFSTRCGGVEDYVDERMGRIYALTDSDGMAKGLKDFIEGKLAFDSEYIRNRVIRKFGMKAFRKTFIDAFHSVMTGG